MRNLIEKWLGLRPSVQEEILKLALEYSQLNRSFTVSGDFYYLIRECNGDDHLKETLIKEISYWKSK